MTPALTEALMWAGITPPPAGSMRTTCPQCSHTRKKSHERCLRLWYDNDLIMAECKHCGWDTAIA
jgi:Zn ribbon nucleic-acid-binding protein